MIKRILKYYLLSMVMVSAYSQDIHFSQFNYTPLNINPALTAIFDGQYRFIGNQRRQWTSVTVPYQTVNVSAEANELLGRDVIQTGLNISHDLAGDSKFSTFNIGISLAHTFKLSADSTKKITFGIQGSFFQQRLSEDELTFDNQYNGLLYDPSLITKENLEKYNYSYLSIAAGVLWNHQITSKVDFVLGMSLYNINKPSQTFYDNIDVLLDRRMNIYSKMKIISSENMTVSPSVLLMKQGTYSEFIGGVEVEYDLINLPFMYRSLFAGMWIRTRDAAFLNVGMGYDNLKVGISYDVNYSFLNPASNYRGGWEIFITYIINKKNIGIPIKVCPDFI